MGTVTYRIRTPQVVHETVDGEVVAIDFATGAYFSLLGPAEAAWRALTDAAPHPVDDVVASVAAAAPDEADPARVVAFLDALVDEGLLERDGAAGDRADLGGLTYEKYADMEDLILLDPVHDVSEAGWPSTPS